MQTSARLTATATDLWTMDGREKREDLLGRVGRMHNATEIFSSLSLADKSLDEIGRGDELDSRVERKHTSPQVSSSGPLCSLRSFFGRRL